MKRILFFAIISIVGMLAISGCDKQKTYDIVFDTNGGTGEMQSQTLTEGESQPLDDNSFVNEGHSFGGWNTLPDGSGVSYSDGQDITLTSDITLYAQWTSNDTESAPDSQQTTGSLNGYEWVDLGLPSGTRWASRNIGAKDPESYGDYYAWGEVTTKEIYYWHTYQHSRGFKEQTSVDSIQLTESQQKAYEGIHTGFGENKPVLLHGVTSSGKTEIYIKLIKEAIDKGKQVLYLLPEIALTAQIINRLKEYFGDRLGVYHSKYGINERVEVWEQVRDFGQTQSSKHQIIIGSRSAIFLPYSDIGLIIVDEEHDSSFKQIDPAPRYNARDAAIVLAAMHKANIVLGSATPSYESYYNALNNRYHLVEIMERFGGVQMPEIILSDMRVERRRKTMKADFGSTLIEAMQETLSEHNQAILFQNRRGFSLRLECDECHHVPQCIKCDVSLIYPKSQNVLRCHYCGYTASVPTECPVCHSTNIRMHGFGTEKIEEDLSLVMPEAKVARLDLDTTRSKNDYQSILEAFQDHDTNILVGTQMVTKGLDFDSVKVVGILNADNMLSFPDFRAHERSFQLMAQVAGRAGRKGKQGKVIIQTYEPAHPVLQDVLRNDFRGLYEKQMVIRRQFGYPPFYRLILIRLKHKDYQKLNPAAAELASMLRPIFKQDLLGPEYPVVSRVKNLYIKQMMVKFRRDYNTQKVKELIAEQIRLFQQNSDYKAVQVQVDVDPM